MINICRKEKRDYQECLESLEKASKEKKDFLDYLGNKVQIPMNCLN